MYASLAVYKPEPFANPPSFHHSWVVSLAVSSTIPSYHGWAKIWQRSTDSCRQLRARRHFGINSHICTCWEPSPLTNRGRGSCVSSSHQCPSNWWQGYSPFLRTRRWVNRLWGCHHPSIPTVQTPSRIHRQLPLCQSATLRPEDIQSWKLRSNEKGDPTINHRFTQRRSSFSIVYSYYFINYAA